MTITYERNCPDCGATAGKPHDDSCDVARCLVTGMQRLQCGDEDFPDGEHPGENCGDEDFPDGEHPGEWPGTAECREYGWWVRWDPPAPGERYGQWTPVPEDADGAVADGNRLIRECDWDKQAKRWVRREEVAR